MNTMIILFNVKIWLVYSFGLSGIVWLVMGFYDYVFNDGKKEDDFYENPIAKREDNDLRTPIPTEQVDNIGMDSIIE